MCYSQRGGKLGELLVEQFETKGLIAKEEFGDKHFFITTKAENEFIKLGIDLSLIKAEKK